MATIYVGFIKSRPGVDGSYPLKIIINANTTTAYIPTRYKIDNINQWRDGRVVKHPDADHINKKLKKLLWEFEEILDEMPTQDLPAKDIKEYLLSQYHKSDSLKAYAENYIDRLKKEKRLSYAQNMGYTLKYMLECFGESMTLQRVTSSALVAFERHLRNGGSSDTTINIRMSHVKALLNAAVNDGTVEYKVFPFRNYSIPAKAVRDICISRTELRELREAVFTGVSARRFTAARDLFMLSFYCAGINLTDLLDARLDGEIMTFVRKKTATRKRGEKSVSITIQPEARAIIDKYITDDGKLDFGYNYKDYEQFRSFITKALNKIGENLGFEKRLMYYSARKTFVQYGTDLGIPLHILEYAVGQSVKDKNSRPIHDYFNVYPLQADMAIRTIISYSMDMEEEDSIPVPEWARKYVKE